VKLRLFYRTESESRSWQKLRSDWTRSISQSTVVHGRGDGGHLVRTIAYWGSTTLVAIMLLTAPKLPHRQRAGRVRICEGRLSATYADRTRYRKAAAAIGLLPGLALVKEWAYVGAGFLGHGAHFRDGVWRTRGGLILPPVPARPSGDLLCDQTVEPATGGCHAVCLN
jgi:hypothetical protein